METSDMITPFVPGETVPDYHAVTTITLGELLTPGGIDWTTPQWSWRDDAYDDTQYSRCCAKIENRYYDRELGVMPPGRWRRHLLRLIAEIMPVLKPLYELANGNPGIFMTDADTWHKTRTVFSDFPATQLVSGQDYASNATDMEYETVTNGNYMDKVRAIRQGDYVDIDVLLLEHINACFSPLWTVNINNY